MPRLDITFVETKAQSSLKTSLHLKAQSLLTGRVFTYRQSLHLQAQSSLKGTDFCRLTRYGKLPLAELYNTQQVSLTNINYYFIIFTMYIKIVSRCLLLACNSCPVNFNVLYTFCSTKVKLCFLYHVKKRHMSVTNVSFLLPRVHCCEPYMQNQQFEQLGPSSSTQAGVTGFVRGLRFLCPCSCCS